MLRILLSVRLGEKRWTQKQLADATGIRRNTINDLYHEMTDRVSLEQLDLQSLGLQNLRSSGSRRRFG